jgi:dihydrofolate reductase
MRITVFNSLTLDGVMQAPGGKDEDTRGGFEHGGWAVPYNDEVMLRKATKGMSSSSSGALLFGRRTYEKFYGYWPHQGDNPFTEVLNKSQKYVASRTLGDVEWQNSTLLEGDAGDAVARLKEQDGPDVVVLGSGDLLQTLITRGLIDSYTLQIHPLVLGSGRRMFPEGAFSKLRLVESLPTTTGVIIATYERAYRTG